MRESEGETGSSARSTPGDTALQSTEDRKEGWRGVEYREQNRPVKHDGRGREKGEKESTVERRGAERRGEEWRG